MSGWCCVPSRRLPTHGRAFQSGLLVDVYGRARALSVWCFSAPRRPCPHLMLEAWYHRCCAIVSWGPWLCVLGEGEGVGSSVPSHWYFWNFTCRTLHGSTHALRKPCSFGDVDGMCCLGAGEARGKGCLPQHRARRPASGSTTTRLLRNHSLCCRSPRGAVDTPLTPRWCTRIGHSSSQGASLQPAAPLQHPPDPAIQLWQPAATVMTPPSPPAVREKKPAALGADNFTHPPQTVRP